jgi:hypothetical protein
VNTPTLTKKRHPAALSNYLKVGFAVYKEEVKG